tara:strand:- start:5023 stop:5319 length:297 start_codon:yes stop_codon:yes gene_type:complete
MEGSNINAGNWTAIDLTAIVLREPPWGDIVIVPVCNVESNEFAGWRRFDQNTLKWSSLDWDELISEVDEAWQNPALTVDILTEDLPLNEHGEFIPFRL